MLQKRVTALTKVAAVLRCGEIFYYFFFFNVY